MAELTGSDPPIAKDPVLLDLNLFSGLLLRLLLPDPEFLEVVQLLWELLVLNAGVLEPVHVDDVSPLPAHGFLD